MMNTVIVTGATSGIGYAICEKLLERGYPVIGVGRSEKNCRAAGIALKETFPEGDVKFLCGDLMQQGEVKRVARLICENIEGERGGVIHALINNAGCVRSRFTTTQEGYEQQFALNYMAGFLLTHELMSLIKSSSAAVIFTSSASHKMMKVNWNDLMYQKHYRPLYAYKQSKLCNMLLCLKLREMGIRACGVDPGLVRTDIGNKDTGGIVDMVWKMRKKSGVPPDKPAEIYRLLCDSGFSGLYYGFEGKELRTSSEVNSQNATRLYMISQKLCGMERGGTA